MKQGDKKSDFNWLSPETADYGSEDFGQILAGKLQDYTSSTLGPGAALHFSNVAIAYTHLYGFDIEGVGANAALVTRSGNQGSIAELRIPAAAGLLHKAWNIVVGPELTWSAEATTTDFASEGQAVIARNALQYYWKHKAVGAKGKAAAFEAMAFAEGALHIPWDTSKGAEVGLELVGEGDKARERTARAGAADYRRVSTWDIIRDPTAKSHEALNWIVIREWPDKYDTAEMCDTEEKRQACLSASMPPLPAQAWLPFRAQYNTDSNRIPVHYLYCKRTPSVPQGRQSIFLLDGTLLSDGPLDPAWDDECPWPVAVMRAGEYAGTVWPYSKWMGTLGAQQASDSLYKDLLTNATAIAGNVLSVEQRAMDSAMDIANHGGGPQVVPRPDGTDAPVVLQLQQSHPEHFKLIGTLRNEQQQLMGIDNITAGQDIGANLSGAAMALMTSTSVQNNSQLQTAWTSFVQDIGNITLRHWQKHMTQPERIALAGNARSSLVSTMELSGDSVAGILRVLPTIGAPLQQTDAGKYEIATTALKEGWAQTPEQFQTVQDTGRLDALTQDLSNELLLINAENEALGKGEDMPVMLDDNHVLHLKSHRSVTSSLTARKDINVINALQAHQDEHIRILRETDPQILQIFGQPSMAAPPQPGATSGTPPPMPGAASTASPQDKAKAAGPSLPTNPATGQKAGAVAGQTPPALAIDA